MSNVMLSNMLKVMSCHIMPCHKSSHVMFSRMPSHVSSPMSRHVTCNVTSNAMVYNFMSYDLSCCHFTFHLISCNSTCHFPCHVTNRVICHVTYHVICLVMCHVILHVTPSHMSCIVISCHIMAHVLSCHVIKCNI